MNDISSALLNFNSIGLNDLEKVPLQNRIDTKYIFAIDALPSILEKLNTDYFILEINSLRMHHYNSLYYDTNNFGLYYQHFRGMLNRYKVRLRKYVDSGLSYFEVKFKSNKGRTIKTRVLLNNNEADENDSQQLLEDTPYKLMDLQAKFWVNYSRITLVSKDFKERLTFDIGLTYKMGDVEVENNQLVIAELKQAKSRVSEFRNLMKQLHIRQSSLSKYCFGVVSLIKDVKKNKFKEQVLTLNKKLYGAATGY